MSVVGSGGDEGEGVPGCKDVGTDWWWWGQREGGGGDVGIGGFAIGHHGRWCPGGGAGLWSMDGRTFSKTCPGHVTKFEFNSSDASHRVD